MTPAEVRAAGRLAGHAFAGAVSRVERVHAAIAGRVFGAIGGTGRPARFAHDTVTAAVYLAVRGTGAAAAVAGGAAASTFAGAGPPVSRTPGGNRALAALNAVTGDALGPGVAALAIEMGVRSRGRDVGLTAHELADAFPGATRRVAVFVHGLAETENSWHRRAGAGHGRAASSPGHHAPSQRVSYGHLLRAEFGYTPVYVRYNTGRHVSVNGRDLGRLLGKLVAAWPQPVEELLLVGHSMGGLVIRSACHHGSQAPAAWVRRVRHVFYLGSPHLGAPLARAAGFAGRALGTVPETRPLVTLVNGSSAGIKDLRYGYLLEDDWAGCDLDRCPRDHRHDVPLLAGAQHYVISATITADPASAVGAVIGDLLVQPGSAHGRRRGLQRIPFPVELGRGLGGMHHFDLLGHPAVWAAMRSLLRPVAAEALVCGDPLIRHDRGTE